MGLICSLSSLSSYKSSFFQFPPPFQIVPLNYIFLRLFSYRPPPSSLSLARLESITVDGVLTQTTNLIPSLLPPHPLFSPFPPSSVLLSSLFSHIFSAMFLCPPHAPTLTPCFPPTSNPIYRPHIHLQLHPCTIHSSTHAPSTIHQRSLTHTLATTHISTIPFIPLPNYIVYWSPSVPYSL